MYLNDTNYCKGTYPSWPGYLVDHLPACCGMNDSACDARALSAWHFLRQVRPKLLPCIAPAHHQADSALATGTSATMLCHWQARPAVAWTMRVPRDQFRNPEGRPGRRQPAAVARHVPGHGLPQPSAWTAGCPSVNMRHCLLQSWYPSSTDAPQTMGSHICTADGALMPCIWMPKTLRHQVHQLQCVSTGCGQKLSPPTDCLPADALRQASTGTTRCCLLDGLAKSTRPACSANSWLANKQLMPCSSMASAPGMASSCWLTHTTTRT
jgi:hypothetical protein